jgi:alkylhydroperoxidase family enzyme
MSRWDLANRPYATSYEDAVAAFGRTAARDPGRALEPLRARPKLVEALRLAVEERERSMLDRKTMARVHRTVEAALPARPADSEGFHTRPDDPVETFAFVGTRYAYRTTQDMIARLRQAGFTDLELLDLAIAVSDANQWARVHRLCGLPGDLFYVS